MQIVGCINTNYTNESTPMGCEGSPLDPFHIFLLNCKSSRRLSLTNTTCFFELFEPVADVVHVQWFPSKFIPALMLLMNNCVSTNHKTHCDYSLSLNIINSMQW